MAEPRAITFKEVEKAAAEGSALDTWRKIGEISGAGHVPASDDATIDITALSESKRGQIDRLLAKEEEKAEEKAAEAKTNKKDGKS